MRRPLLCALWTLSVLLGMLPAAQAASYTFASIAVPFPGAAGTQAFGIDSRGQIVGSYIDNSGGHGFLATPRKK